MNLDIFKTPKQLPFLYYSGNPELSLNVGSFAIIEPPPPDELWSTVDIGKLINHQQGHFLAAAKLMSAVAFRTRRACGNILIVPNDAEREIFENEFPLKRMDDTIKIVVDTSLAPNELRSTYWQLRSAGDSVECVDGGIQISPEGFSCIQKTDDIMSNFSDYFVRGFYE